MKRFLRFYATLHMHRIVTSHGHTGAVVLFSSRNLRQPAVTLDTFQPYPPVGNRVLHSSGLLFFFISQGFYTRKRDPVGYE